MCNASNANQRTAADMHACASLCILQGDGVWLPRAPFAGTAWVTTLHRELFSEYTGWSFKFLELAATAGAMKGFTEVLGFFHWQATNTGAATVQHQGYWSWGHAIGTTRGVSSHAVLQHD